MGLPWLLLLHDYKFGKDFYMSLFGFFLSLLSFSEGYGFPILTSTILS